MLPASPTDSVVIPWHRRSLAFELGSLFVLLALVIGGAGAAILLNLRRLDQVAHRYMEESREERVAERLEIALGELAVLTDEGARRSQRLRPVEELLLGEARSSLDAIVHAGGGDPSKPAHQAAEDALLAGLHANLEVLGRFVRDEGAGSEEATRALDDARSLARRIDEETSQEAFQATADLERRVTRLGEVMAATVLLSGGVLAFAGWRVHRHVVVPVRALSEGSRLFGAGRLDHRIAPGPPNELGRLARDWNRMARSIASSQAELEARVKERTAQFLQAARLADMGVFAAGVAHEVNTPLATIASAAEGLDRRLRSGDVPRSEVISYLETIAGEAYRAHEITERLLAFGRSGTPAPVEAPMDVGGCIERADALMRHAFDRAGVRRRLQIDPDLPRTTACGTEMAQVLTNLLANAIDASPRGGEVLVSARASAGEIVIEVADEGPGVPEADRARIFEPFFTTKPPGKGTGLGLALAFRIVEAQGGRLGVENRAAGGALFRITLPAAGVPAAP